jgi:hypothetical protein
MKLLKSLPLVLTMAAATLFAAAIPPGTDIRVRTTSLLSSKTAHEGDTWEGTLAANVNANGKIVARKGDRVDGKVTAVKTSGRLSNPGMISLAVTSVNGEEVSTDSHTAEAGSHKKRNIGSVAGGSALGAIIGGIAGGGKGAAIGAGAGGAAGTAGAAATGKKEAEIPAETILTFRTN